MSLVTCIDLGDKVSLMSDGLMTKEDGSFYGDGFKKFLIRKDHFIAITNSQIVAEVYFNEIEKKNLSSNSTKKLLDETFKSLNKPFNIVLGMTTDKQFTYTIYTHFAGEYEEHQNIAHFSGYPLVMNSSYVDEHFVSKFKESIKILNENRSSPNTIISKQKKFHRDVAKIDTTVNNELFHEYYVKI